MDRADPWPANPDGELLIIAIIESRQGVENIESILDATNGIGAIWAGSGDMAADMGLIGQLTHPEVEENLQHVLDVCLSRNVACAIGAGGVDEAVGRIQQGFRIIMTRPGIKADIRARIGELL